VKNNCPGFGDEVIYFISHLHSRGRMSVVALSPFPNLEIQHDGRECRFWLQNILCFEMVEKGLLGAPKMDFIRLRNNESTLMIILVRISTEIIYQSAGSGS
jgi:hypothetical protein